MIFKTKVTFLKLQIKGWNSMYYGLKRLGVSSDNKTCLVIKDFIKDLLIYLQFSQSSVIVTFFAFVDMSSWERSHEIVWSNFRQNTKYYFRVFFYKIQERSKFEIQTTIYFEYGEEVEKMLNLQHFSLFKRLSQNLILAGLITMKVKNFHYIRVTWFSLSLVIITPEKSA